MQLVYVSSATITFDDAALRELLKKAREKNSLVGVTGMLLHQKGTFLQVLEGVASVVDSVYARIARDPRHRHVIMLSRRDDLVAPCFSDWTMGFVDVRGTAKILPGFRTIGDLGGLAGDSAAIAKVVASFRDGRWRNELLAA